MWSTECILFAFYVTRVLGSPVFGGHEIQTQEHKSLVRLEFQRKTIVKSICSGSIITTRWIITAAHCINNNIFDIAVVMKNINKDGIIGEVVSSNAIQHPLFLNSGLLIEYDLALLKTTNTIKFDKNVQPIKLADEQLKGRQRAVIAGFGMSEHVFGKSRQADVTVHLCQVVHTVGSYVICSYGYRRAGRGDSGGALVSNTRLIGVTSGVRCSHSLTVYPQKCTTYYSDVAKNVQWIKDIIK